MDSENKRGPERKANSDAEKYIEALRRLLPGELAEIIFLSEINDALLPGQSAPPIRRVEAFVKLYAQQHNGKMGELKDSIETLLHHELSLPDTITDFKTETSTNEKMPDEWSKLHTVLCKLMPAQFGKLIFVLGVDSSKLLSDAESLSNRARSLLEFYTSNEGDLMQIQTELLKIAPGLAEYFD
ncbi:MAG TPA: hypothetical protein VJB64_00285 [Patescibacteria group bacterium]|nr:hypothetical protein [Patescibacteria group bacterium]